MGINFTDSLGQTIAFEVYPSSVIGTRFNNAIVRGVVDHSGVTEFNPAVMHANVFATLPSGSVDDFRKYNYLRLELENGNITFVGIPWIIASSVQLSAKASYRIVIKGVEPGDVENIRKGLINRGLDVESFEKIE